VTSFCNENQQDMWRDSKTFSTVFQMKKAIEFSNFH